MKIKTKTNLKYYNTSRKLLWARQKTSRLKDWEYFQNFTGKRPLGKPRRRCEDNIRKDLEEKGFNAGNWVD